MDEKGVEEVSFLSFNFNSDGKRGGGRKEEVVDGYKVK